MNRRVTIAVVAAVALLGVVYLSRSSGPRAYNGPGGCSVLSQADIGRTATWGRAVQRSDADQLSVKTKFNETFGNPRLGTRQVGHSKVSVGSSCSYRFGRIEDALSPKALGSMQITVYSMRFFTPEWTSLVLVPGPTVPGAMLDGIGQPRLAMSSTDETGLTACTVVQQIQQLLVEVGEYGRISDCSDTIRLARAARGHLVRLAPKDP